MYTEDHCLITFVESSTILFKYNNATLGGAIHSTSLCNISFNGMSTVTLNYNRATKYGGAVYSTSYSYILFHGNSQVIFQMLF